MRLYIIIVVALLSVGCSTVTLKNFDKSDYSMTSDNVLTVLYSKYENSEVSFVGVTADNASLGLNLKLSDDIMSSITDTCGELKEPNSDELIKSFAVPVAVIPIATALAKFIFDQSVDNANRELETIKKAAVRAYSSKSIIESGFLKKSKCVLLIRDKIANIKNSESWDISNAGLVMLLVKQDYGDAFTYRPVYVNAKNTVALTKAGTSEKNEAASSNNCHHDKNDKDKYARIDIAVAMSLKAIIAQGGTLRKLSPIGEGVTSIPSVEMKKDNANSCVKTINDDKSDDNFVVGICHQTDLLPYQITGSNQKVDFVALPVFVWAA